MKHVKLNKLVKYKKNAKKLNNCFNIKTKTTRKRGNKINVIRTLNTLPEIISNVKMHCQKKFLQKKVNVQAATSRKHPVIVKDFTDI